MKKVTLNGFVWWYEKETGFFFENEDKAGSKIRQANKHFTEAERSSIIDQLAHSEPMFSH